MIELIIKNGLTLSYDEKNEIILVNGKASKDWIPVFIPSGDNDFEFFGFKNRPNNKLYDINGNEIKLTNEDNIKLGT
jgi:hypothetical protein